MLLKYFLFYLIYSHVVMRQELLQAEIKIDMLRSIETKYLYFDFENLKIKVNLLSQHPRFVSFFSMVTKLNLYLKRSKHYCIILSNRMCSINDSFTSLFIQQVQLDWIPRVNVGITIEIFTLQ